MLLTSNGGELRSSKSVLIDGGGSSSTATQNLQYVSITGNKNFNQAMVLNWHASSM
jgi:hypothetical protein